MYKGNTFFTSKPDAVKIILYQDAFEVVNPLGSAKRKHKMLAVYMTLADIFPHNRSNVDHMQLVLLCREAAFKTFGHAKVFSRLLTDLKKLEKDGVTVANGQTLHATVLCIVGDNLGSHCIGGFTENFSFSDHFCRYCNIPRTAFFRKPYSLGEPRTKESYNSDATIAESEDRLVHGVKFASVFNELNHFHVCQPGLPPCLGHDLFEGVVSYDMALCLKYFVKDKKWFSYAELNRLVNQFKYLASDSGNKPNDISAGGAKIGGHAAQNWCLLRLIPLILAGRIVDYDDAVWQLLLQLREIVCIVCAPAVTPGQVAYLKVVTEDYIDMHATLFPDTRLKPKHHYMAHYAELILLFGPLIRLWTMRFESKHCYFKKCARSVSNFRNLCHSLAERHQLLQAYLSAGDIFRTEIQCDQGIPFFEDTYTIAIQNAVMPMCFSCDDTVVTTTVTVKGTSYKKGLYVPLEHSSTY